MEAFRLTRAASVRGAMAAHLIGIDGSAALGDIVLHPHQVDAVRRLARMLAERRGALLADDVGLGKTYVALAVAREWASPLIVVPAALRASWHAAMAQTGVRAMTCSIESLSYSLARFEPDLVIIDEAHHLRNSATKRFASAATLCQRAHVLLMTATPVQNRLDDLRALLSLFLGRHAYALTDGELAAHCVRRSAEDVPSELLRLPRIQAPAWLPRVADADCLERILALPPPFATSDGSDGGVLTTYTLVRQWSSSRAALSGGIRRRIGRGLALESALEADRFPSRRELQAWVCADGDVQLAFAELVAPAIASDAGALLGQVHDHLDALREFLAWIDASADADVARAAVLRDLMARHPGERVVAFSAYGDTVRRLYALLSPDIRSAMLTHSSGKVSGGPISRRELLERFDPSLAKRVPASDHVHLLLATDVCSEGVSLHAASVVVHLDLAWNPARLAQRVGRLRRIGAPRECVSVYLAPPPASAARMLQIETVLHRKLMAAASSVGVPDAVLPELQPDARGVAL
ncbi:MAG TPA: DEAD/DEAH box helicase, partial [Gemmatimonadaceae bacterium]|nr:DEAD/DEAH box helicase [Gemmatimonadaceae bacterium]